jgi:AcrR family transcriptional regulator
MSKNSDGASSEGVAVEALPEAAQAFHRRARIVDAAVREIAERGYAGAAEEAIAERAGVSRQAFFEIFADKEEALIWAYDAAAAYAIPQILRALRAERSWARGAAAALSTYLAILDCDRAWALACLRDVPAAGERVRAARDAVRAPVLDALQGPGPLPAAGGVGVETMLLALDPDNANGLCEFADGSKSTPTCPKASIVGTATATTPILDEPLSGPVYFVKNIRKDPKSGREIRTLPKLVIPLVGQNGVKLTLTGTSDVVDDQLVTTFDNIPDAPVSSFKLNIIGGKGGILTVSGTDICKATQVADQQIDGQNNKNADTDIYIQTPSCALKVLSKKVGKSSVAVKVGGLSAGKVTVTGRGIKKTTKTITKSTVATITAKRSKGKPGKVTVSFDPTGPAKAHKTTK